MLQDIIFVQALPDYKLLLRFEDDVEGVVDLQQLIEFKGIFEPLKDVDFFSRVSVNEDLGTICWENCADLDPQVLYTIVTTGNYDNDVSLRLADEKNRLESLESTQDKLLKIIGTLSDNLVLQVLNYAEYLQYKQQTDG
jgi:Protein of unknown function (DUF2442)